MTDLPDDVKRWTAKRRQALLMHIWRGETTKVEAARLHGLTVREIEEWKRRRWRRWKTVYVRDLEMKKRNEKQRSRS